jgi:hypothetical protein
MGTGAMQPVPIPVPISTTTVVKGIFFALKTKGFCEAGAKLSYALVTD